MNVSDTRARNEAALLRSVAVHERTDRCRLMADTGLSKATVSRLVRALVDDGRLVEGPVDRGAEAARATQSIELASADDLLCGVDLGGASTRFLLTDHRARLVLAWRRATPAGRPGPALADWLWGEVLAACRQAGRCEPVGLVVGVPGSVGPDGRGVAHAPNVPGVGGREFTGRLATRVGRLTVENDATLALIGEVSAGAARGARAAAMITVGTGVGAGVALDGRIVRGASGLVGEVGLLPVALDGTTVEQVLGGPALVAAAVEAGIAATDATTALAATGAAADALRERTVGALAAVCTALAVSVEPQVVVVGGGVAGALAPLLPRVAARLEDRLGRSPALRTSTLGDPAGAVGAVATALTGAFARLGAAVDPGIDPDVALLVAGLADRLGAPPVAVAP